MITIIWYVTRFSRHDPLSYPVVEGLAAGVHVGNGLDTQILTEGSIIAVGELVHLAASNHQAFGGRKAV
jgi:hypothetical protein